MERRRRFLFRELLPGCDLMIAMCALPERSSPDAARLPLPLGEDGGESLSGI